MIEQLNKFRVLTEKNLNRISKGHEKDGYVAISASRGDYSEQENNARTNKLKKFLKDKGYSYISIYGGYKEDNQDEASMEKSFIVYPYDVRNNEKKDFDAFLSDMKDIAETYEQDSILVCEPNGKPHYIGIKVDVQDGDFNDVVYNDTDKMFFTAIKKWNDSSLNKKGRPFDKGKPQRFTFECYIKCKPSNNMEGHRRWAELDLNHLCNEDE